MAFRYRPRPDMDSLESCKEAGWTSIIGEVNRSDFEPSEGLTYEEVAIGAKRTGRAQQLMHVGEVCDVSETIEGEKFLLPVPLPDAIWVEQVPDIEVFDENI